MALIGVLACLCNSSNNNTSLCINSLLNLHRERRFDDSLKIYSIPYNSTQVPVTLQELLNVRSALDTIHKLGEPRVILEPSTTVLSELLIVTDLVDDEVGIRDLLTDHKRTRLGRFVRAEVLVERLEEVCAVALLVLGVELVLVWREKGNDEESAP